MGVCPSTLGLSLRRSSVQGIGLGYLQVFCHYVGVVGGASGTTGDGRCKEGEPEVPSGEEDYGVESRG